jgi:hypothetical protein
MHDAARASTPKYSSDRQLLGFLTSSNLSSLTAPPVRVRRQLLVHGCCVEVEHGRSLGYIHQLIAIIFFRLTSPS